MESARHFPERNFLGIERLLGRVRKTCRVASETGLTNLRVLRLELDYTVRYLLPENSVWRFHLNFPDPWPKRRHQTRRVVDGEFLEAIHRGLIDDGELWIKTDHEAYFQQITKAANASDDSAVAPEKLGAYVRDLRKLLDEYGYQATYYGHFGHGCIHMQTSFDLQSEAGIRKYGHFVERAADLVVSYGGSISGEHGDGLLVRTHVLRRFGLHARPLRHGDARLRAARRLREVSRSAY